MAVTALQMPHPALMHCPWTHTGAGCPAVDYMRTL